MDYVEAAFRPVSAEAFSAHIKRLREIRAQKALQLLNLRKRSRKRVYDQAKMIAKKALQSTLAFNPEIFTKHLESTIENLRRAHIELLATDIKSPGEATLFVSGGKIRTSLQDDLERALEA